MLFVQHNLLAMNANRQLKVNTDKNAKIAEKLSSGYKINRAADDAAGLAISEKMRRQVRGLRQGADNIKDGIGYVQTAEGALNEVHDMLQRMNELAVKAANGTNTETDRAYIDSEVQALKEEIDRIFSTTSFNEQRIWVTQESREIVDYRPEQAVRFTDSTSYFDITDENCGVIAENGYNIKADENGVIVSWTGYNGKSYETETIEWQDLKRDNYSFEISDHFKASDIDLISPTTGDKLIKHKVSMSVNSLATLDEIIAAINGPNNNGTTMSRCVESPISARLEDVNGNATSKQWDGYTDRYVNFTASLYYTAAYQSFTGSTDGYDFDTERDDFIYPTINGTTNLQCPSADDEKWIFSFYMEGIGAVTAESSSISFTANDETGTENVWWEWHNPPYGTLHKDGKTYSISGGTPATVKAALSPDSANGLLNKDTYGAADASGSITLYFNLKSGNNIIGSISTTIPVKCGKNGETTQEVLDRIDGVFNANTILDIYTDNNDVQGNDGHIHQASAWTSNVYVPVYGGILYGGTRNFYVQAGAEAGQHIEIEYECLSLNTIGLADTNTLTEESAGNAINEIKEALQTISDQRSLLGADPNRLEHA